MKNLKSRIRQGGLLILAVVGLSVVSNSTAQAQYRQYPNDRDGQYRRDRDDDNYRRDRDRDHDRREHRDDRYGRNRGYDNNGDYGNYGGYNNIYRRAQNQGYQDGLNTGANDADRRKSYDPQRSHYYKDASRNDRQYAHVYRDGFLQGYDAGYRQYRGYGNGGYRRNTGRGMGGVLGGILGLP